MCHKNKKACLFSKLSHKSRRGGGGNFYTFHLLLSLPLTHSALSLLIAARAIC